MPYKFFKDHTFINYTEGNTGREYIVIHYTGNKTDTATANANYFRDVNRQASAHYFVDEVNVVEVVAPENTAWAVGVDYGGKLFGICNNSNSISIEMCSIDSRITEQTFNNTVELTKELMKKYGIPASHVVRHYDVCKKLCPGWAGWVGDDLTEWKRFKKALTALTALTAETVKIKSSAGGYARAETDPIGGSVQRKNIFKKGIVVRWVEDDGYGWSKVKYQGRMFWVINGRINKKDLSKCPTTKLPKGTPLLPLNKSKTAFEKTVILKKEKTFTVICIITQGKYKGYYYLKRNGRYYYARHKRGTYAEYSEVGSGSP